MVSIGPRIYIAGETEFRASLNRIISGVKNFESELNLTVGTFSKFESAMTKSKRETEALTKLIGGQKIELSALKDGLQKATEKEDSRKQALERAIETYKSAVRTYGEESKEAEAAEQAVYKADRAHMQSMRTLEDWKTKVNEGTLELAEMEKKLREVPSALDIWGDRISNIGDKMSTIGTTLSKYITTPLMAIGGASVKAASDFEDGMAKIYTIATEDQIPMEEMKQQLVDLSNETGYGLDDLTEATYQSVSASVDAAKAVEFMGTATKLARGGFTTTTRSVDLLTTVINAYGTSVDEASHISDVLLKTQNDGKTIIDELAGSMGTVIPTAANYGISLEDLAAVYATLTKQGVNTARATTFMNAMFTELEKPSSDVADLLFNKTGKSFAQLMKEGNNLADVLDILYTAVDGDTERFQLLFGNIRSGRAAAALTNREFSTLREEIDRMNNSTGQTAYALEVLETPSLKAKRAMNQIKNSSVELGQTMITMIYPYFMKVIDAVKRATEWFNGLDEGTQQTIVKFGALAAAAGPVLTVGGKLIDGIGKFVSKSGEMSTYLTDFATYASGKGGIVETLGNMAGGLGKFVGYVPAIAGVTAAFVGLGAVAKVGLDQRLEEINAQWGLNEELQKSVDTINSLSGEYQNNIKSIQENRDATYEQTFLAQNLVDEYNKLVDANGLVDEKNREHADFILNQLAEALGMEHDDLLALIEDNGKFGESVQHTIEDIRKRAETTALEQMYTEAIQTRTKAELELEKQEQALQGQQEKVTQAQDEYNRALENYQKYYDAADSGTWHYRTELDNATQALGSATGAQIEMEQAIDEATKTMDDANKAAEFYAGKISGEVSGAAEDATTAVQDAGGKIVNTAEKTGQEAADAVASGDVATSGYNFVAGFAGAIDRYAFMARNSAYAMSSGALHGLNAGIQVASPSKLAFKSGRFFGEGFINGIDAMRQEAMNSATLMGDSALYGLDTVDSLTTNATKNISAPITINATIEGNVDSSDRTREIADNLANLIFRENEVFA